MSSSSNIPFQTGSQSTDYALYGNSNQPLIVLCNGIGASSFAWTSLIKALSSSYCCLIWHYEGTRTPAQKELTITTHAESLVTLITELNRPVFALIGWSMGVQVALEAALILPSAPQALVLLNGAAQRPTSHILNQPWLWPSLLPIINKIQHTGKWLNRLTRELQSSPKHLQYFTQLFVSTRCLSSDLDRKHFTLLLEQWLSIDLQLIASQLLKLDQSDNRAQAQQLDVPVLVVAGAKDPLVALCSTRELAELLPSSELVVFNNSTHFTLMEAAEQLNLLITSFLQRIDHDTA